MTKLYKVNGYRSGGKVRFSVDEVDSSGKYICQAAFFFKSRAEAEKRMTEMIAEDAVATPWPITSAAWKAVSNG
jgi:hypothetical protein